MSVIDFQRIFNLGKEYFDYSDPAKAPHLIYRGSFGGFTDYALTREENTIGRSKKNHIVINDVNVDGFEDSPKKSTVSKMHAVIYRERECAFVQDKSTLEQITNGVKVNQERLKIGEKKMLKNGDILKFGPNLSMTFYDSADKIPVLNERNLIKFDEMHLIPIIHPNRTSVDTTDFFQNDGKKDIDDEDLISDYEKLLCIYELLKISNDASINQHYEKAFQSLLNLDKSIEFGAIFLKDRESNEFKMKYITTKSDVTKVNASEFIVTNFFEKALQSDFIESHEWKKNGLIYAAPFLGEISGLLCIYSHSSPVLTTKSLDLFRAITNQLSVTIDNRILMIEQTKSARFKEQISRFLPPEIVKTMTKEHELFKQGARKVNATILFVDIRGFTSYSEKCTPEVLVTMLNEYFERLVQCVFKHNGIVDKFIGDCLMAVFGAVESDPNPALRALKAAFDIEAVVTISLRENLQKKGIAPITVGIGLHTGEVLAGFFGSQNRREYSVQGDNVYIASKACDAANNNCVCATKETLHSATPFGKIPTNVAGSATIKGQKEHVAFYCIFNQFNNENESYMTSIMHDESSGLNEQPKNDYPANRPENHPYLVSQKHYGANELFYLKKEKTAIGKAPRCDIRLNLQNEESMKSVSKQHAEIIRKVEGDLIVGVYLYRTKGGKETSVNGESLPPNTKWKLKNGDKLAFGNVIFMEYYQDRNSIPSRYLENAFENIEWNSLAKIENVSADKMSSTVLLKTASFFQSPSKISNRDAFLEDYENLRRVYHLTTTSSNNLEGHLERALDYIFNILPMVQNGALVLIDSKIGPSAKLVKFRNAEDTEIDIVLNRTIFSKVYETKMKIISTGMHLPENEFSNSSFQDPNTVLCIPLISHEKVHGILYLNSPLTSEPISEKSLSLLDAICNQMSTAIENSKVKLENLNSSKMMVQLYRYLSPALVQKISNPEEALSKKVSRKKATIMYVNIIDFSSFRNKNTDAEIENCLNTFFEIAVNSVFKYNGTVDKYIGNQLMAVFGALEDIPDPELRAVRAALEVKTLVASMNQERSIFKKDEIAIKIGINTGTVVTGLIGSTLRLEYTVIGDAVNIAARTTSSATENQILITEYTYGCVKKSIDVVKIGEKQFKGKSQPITCYEAKAYNNYKSSSGDLSAFPPLPGKEPSVVNLLVENGFL